MLGGAPDIRPTDRGPSRRRDRLPVPTKRSSAEVPGMAAAQGRSGTSARRGPRASSSHGSGAGDGGGGRHLACARCANAPTGEDVRSSFASAPLFGPAPNPEPQCPHPRSAVVRDAFRPHRLPPIHRPGLARQGDRNERKAPAMSRTTAIKPMANGRRTGGAGLSPPFGTLYAGRRF